MQKLVLVQLKANIDAQLVKLEPPPVRWGDVVDGQFGPAIEAVIDDRNLGQTEDCWFYLIRVGQEFDPKKVGRMFNGRTKDGVKVFSPCIS